MRAAPLHGSFMITAIVGMLVSVIYVWPSSLVWGFTLALFFLLMFVASLISMTLAPITD